jgi:hypothetical protein
VPETDIGSYEAAGGLADPPALAPGLEPPLAGAGVPPEEQALKVNMSAATAAVARHGRRMSGLLHAEGVWTPPPSAMGDV